MFELKQKMNFSARERVSEWERERGVHRENNKNKNGKKKKN